MPINIEREDKLSKKFNTKLPEDWRVRVQAMSTDELKEMVLKIASDENENQKKKLDDLDLIDAHEKYTNLNSPYKEGTTINALKIRFTLRELERNGAV